MMSPILESIKTSYKVFFYLSILGDDIFRTLEASRVTNLYLKCFFFQGDHWQDVYSGMHNSSFPFSLREEITKQDITGYYSSF